MSLLEDFRKNEFHGLEKPLFFPGNFYTDPELLSLEIKHIFQKTWIYVGDLNSLARSHNVIVTEITGSSILIIRNEKDELKAFHNVCPHRAALLCPQLGTHHLKQLVCPYHAWVYNLDGKLVGIPQKDKFPDNFDPDQFPLKPVRCEQWQGFIFISLDPGIPPLKEFLGIAGDTLKSHHTQTTTLLIKKNYTVQCNWKNYHDNTLCDYHVPIVHRQTLNPLQGSVRFYEHYFDQYVNLLYTPTPQHWREKNSILEHLSERDRLGFFTYGIFPNLHLLALPNGIIAWIRIDPIAVNQSQINLEIYGIPDRSPSPHLLLDEFEAFMKEDMEITEIVQKGYASGAYSPGISNQLEARIIHQQALISQFLSATEPHQVQFSQPI